MGNEWTDYQPMDSTTPERAAISDAPEPVAPREPGEEVSLAVTTVAKPA